MRKASTSPKAGRRARVAAATAAGKPVTAIAEELGVSRSTVHRDIDATRQVIAELTSRYFDRIETSFLRTLDAIDAAFGARRWALSKFGARVDLGRDHYARLTAGKLLVQLASAGRPTPKAPEVQETRPVTLDQIRELIHAHDAADSSTDPNTRTTK